MSDKETIIIAGAGIGGLSAALALAHHNIPVLLLERGKLLCEVGAGIQISPNATDILQNWGVWPYLSEQGVIPSKINIRSGVSGGLLSSLATSEISNRYGSPYMAIHRADIQRALYMRAKEMDLIDMREGVAVESVSQGEEGVQLRCRLEDGEEVVHSGAALIGADGVWSKIRTQYMGNSPAVYSGKTAWRVTMPMQMVPEHIDSKNVGLWLSPKAHVVHYPIVAGHMMNIVAIVDEAWEEEGWNAPGNAAWLNQRFAHWPLEMRELLFERDNWLKWALCGVDPSQPWTKGKVALLGDAAHAMLPFMAQGAVMAIEDAAVLGRALTEVSGPVENALAAYERARKERACQVVARAKKNGDIYHMGGAMAFARNMAMKMMSQSKMLDQFHWIYGWKLSDVRFDS